MFHCMIQSKTWNNAHGMQISIFLKFCMLVGPSECTKTVKYFDSMSAFACARKYLRLRPCYKIGNAKILKMMGF